MFKVYAKAKKNDVEVPDPFLYARCIAFYSVVNKLLLHLEVYMKNKKKGKSIFHKFYRGI